MHGHLEDEISRSLDAQDLPSYRQMTAAADRQELRQSLDQPQQQSLPPVHFFVSFPRKTPMMATTSTTMPARITIGAATSRRKSNIA